MFGGKAITFDQSDASAKALAVERRQIAVHFASDHVRVGLHQKIREGAGARTDFKNHFAGGNVGGLHKRAKHVVIMQEVLPKAMLGTQAARGKNGFDFRECLHCECPTKLRGGCAKLSGDTTEMRGGIGSGSSCVLASICKRIVSRHCGCDLPAVAHGVGDQLLGVGGHIKRVFNGGCVLFSNGWLVVVMSQLLQR